MTTATTTLNVRLPSSLKAEAAAILGAAGLTLSDAVRIMFKRTVAERRLPFDVFGEARSSSIAPTSPLDNLRAVMRELRQMEEAAHSQSTTTFSAPRERQQMDAAELRQLWGSIASRAKAQGVSEMTLEEINAEIAATRREMAQQV